MSWSRAPGHPEEGEAWAGFRAPAPGKTAALSKSVREGGEGGTESQGQSPFSPPIGTIYSLMPGFWKPTFFSVPRHGILTLSLIQCGPQKPFSSPQPPAHTSD